MKYATYLFLGLIAFSSCSSDDDSHTNPWDKKILGSWVFDRYEVNNEGVITSQKYSSKHILEFRENGLVVSKVYYTTNSSNYRLWPSEYHIENDSLFCMWTDEEGNGVKIQSLTTDELIYNTNKLNQVYYKGSIMTVFLKRVSNDEK